MASGVGALQCHAVAEVAVRGRVAVVEGAGGAVALGDVPEDRAPATGPSERQEIVEECSAKAGAARLPPDEERVEAAVRVPGPGVDLLGVKGEACEATDIVGEPQAEALA